MKNSEAEISRVEKKLGVRLHPKYRDLLSLGELRRWGVVPSGRGDGYCLLRFYSVDSSDYSLEQQIEMLPFQLPEPWIPIGSLNGGSLLLNNESGEIGAVVWESLGEREMVTINDIDLVGPNLSVFIENLGAPQEVPHPRDAKLFRTADDSDIHGLRVYVERGGEINLLNPDGESVLEVGLLLRDLPYCKACVELGAAIGQALHTAAESNYVDGVEWLLEIGADPNLRDSQGRLAVDMTPAFTGSYRLLKEAMEKEQ